MQDSSEMREPYGRCSELLHSSAECLHPSLATPRIRGMFGKERMRR